MNNVPTTLQAKPIFTEVRREVFEKSQTGVTLVLNMKQADFVHDLMKHVGGLPHYTRRGIAAEVLEAMQFAGVKGTARQDLSGSVTCLERDPN